MSLLITGIFIYPDRLGSQFLEENSTWLDLFIVKIVVNAVSSIKPDILCWEFKCTELVLTIVSVDHICCLSLVSRGLVHLELNMPKAF